MHKSNQISIRKFDAIQENHIFSGQYEARKEDLIQRYRQGRMESRRLLWRSPAVAAACLIVILPVTAFAVGKLYHFTVEQKDKYQVEIGIQGSSEEAESGELVNGIVSAEIQEMELHIGYIPEGLTTYEKGYITEDHSDHGYILDNLYVDTEGSWNANFVTYADTVSVEGREAMLIHQQSFQSSETSNEDLYISFPEYHRIVHIDAWGHVDREELLRIAESIELEPTGQIAAQEDVHLWSDYLSNMQGRYQNLDVADSDISSVKTVKDQAMANLHQMNEVYMLNGAVGDEGISDALSVRVTDVQLLNDYSTLQDAHIPEEWKELLEADGSLGNAERNYIKYGNGIDRLHEVVKSEEVPMRLLYVTIEYSNTSDTDLHNVWFMGNLMKLRHNGEVWQLVTPWSEGYDNIYYQPRSAGIEELGYYDVANWETEKNHIPSLPAGKTEVVHMAWLIGADETENLYLNINGRNDNGTDMDDADLRVGYVELKVE